MYILLASFNFSTLNFCFWLSENFTLRVFHDFLMLPSRQVVAWHRPYCVDLEESTFSHLRSFLERYCDKINSEIPPLPFPSSRYVIYVCVFVCVCVYVHTCTHIYYSFWILNYSFLLNFSLNYMKFYNKKKSSACICTDNRL